MTYWPWEDLLEREQWLDYRLTLLFHLFKFVNASKIISGENIIHNIYDESIIILAGNERRLLINTDFSTIQYKYNLPHIYLNVWKLS